MRCWKTYKLILTGCIIVLGNQLFAQATMANAQEKSILLVNGYAHLGTGKYYQKSLIGIKDGKLAEVFNANVVQAENLKYDTVIDISGKHVYPGFIAPNSTLGITEIGAVRASHDFRETGLMNPNIRSIIAYNTDSRITPTVRSNGVLLAQVTPRGGYISGSSSIVELDGWNWEDALYKEDDGIHLNWPRYWKEDPNRNTDAKAKPKKSRAEVRAQIISSIESFFKEARAYAKSSYNYEYNLRFEAMRGLFDGNKKLFIHADHVKELIEAIYFKRDLDIPEMVVVGGYDAWRIPEVFVDNDVAIVLKRVHSLPRRADEDIDQAFKNPALLHEAGVLFCLDNSGRMETMGTRNLMFYAGTARTFGLNEEVAVQSITLNAAKILGIDERCGSIETGKDATIIVSSGDALDMRTNNIEMALIQGKFIDLDNDQKKLYRKYKERNDALIEAELDR